MATPAELTILRFGHRRYQFGQRGTVAATAISSASLDTSALGITVTLSDGSHGGTFGRMGLTAVSGGLDLTGNVIYYNGTASAAISARPGSMTLQFNAGDDASAVINPVVQAVTYTHSTTGYLADTIPQHLAAGRIPAPIPRPPLAMARHDRLGCFLTRS